jgi:hypothetical protein
MIRRLTITAVMLTSLTLGVSSSVLAQDAQPGPAPNVTRPGAAAPNVTFGQRTYYLEIFMVVVLFGGALFAVCRSSERR